MTDAQLQQASGLLDLFSDADRLRLIGRLVEGDATLTELAAELRLKPQTIAKHLRSLEEAGLVLRTRETASVTFDIQHLRQLAANLRPEPSNEFGDEADDDARVLRSFVVEGRLTRLPSQRSRWLPVLRWLAEGFESGVDYPEPEVNERLGAINEDYALLRRQLVDEGLMTRDRGVYRRVAGS